MRASCLQMGGLRPLQPLRLFKPSKLAWKHMNHVQHKTPRHVTAMQMEEAASPQPPRFFLLGKLAWKHMNHL